MQALLNFTQVESSHGPVFRANFNGCMLELSPDKKILQVIDSDSESDTYRVICDECTFLSSTKEGTLREVCYFWTTDDWYAVEDAIQKA